MNNITYQDFISKKYELIFEYFDRPLSFIAKINEYDYLCYFIKNTEYFISLVTRPIALKLNQVKDLSKLYPILERENLINVITLDPTKKQARIVSLLTKPNLKIHIPREPDEIIYDYHNEKRITYGTNLLKYLSGNGI